MRRSKMYWCQKAAFSAHFIFKSVCKVVESTLNRLSTTRATTVPDLAIRPRPMLGSLYRKRPIHKAQQTPGPEAATPGSLRGGGKSQNRWPERVSTLTGYRKVAPFPAATDQSATCSALLPGRRGQFRNPPGLLPVTDE